MTENIKFKSPQLEIGETERKATLEEFSKRYGKREQTAIFNGYRKQGFFRYHFWGQSLGFSQTEDTFEGLLTRITPSCFMTPLIITLNILVFVLTAVYGVSLISPDQQHLLDWGANFGPFTVSQWWRLFSSTFLHIGVIHLLFNMWCLWSLGNYAERMFGSWTFLMLYVLSALGGSIASIWWHPRVVSAGASGAIFGVAGGLIAFLAFGKIQIPRSVIYKNLTNVLCFVGYNVFYGLIESGIDNAAHLGGLFVGVLIGAFLHRPLLPSKDYTNLRHYVVFGGISLLLILAALAGRTQVANDPITKLFESAKLMDSGELKKAMKSLDKAIELDPRLAAAYYLRGILYQKKNIYHMAIFDYSKAIELNPRFAEAYNNRGILYESKFEYEKAISDYNEAIKLKPKFVAAYANRGTIMSKLGNMKTACSDWQMLCELGDCLCYENAKRDGDCE